MDLDHKHNTNQQLLHLMNKIYENLNKSKQEFTLGIFLDLKKAFNCCDLDILLKKIIHHGFKNVANTWFKNYLSVLTFMHGYFNDNLPCSFQNMLNSLAEPNRTKSFKLD